ncbi:MAG: serine hydrolase domain-containing protein [Pyrinomonadaceae bacterium]|nr:serine hydrolase domain-containing protein [Pyrinomonadaceae bacterium]
MTSKKTRLALLLTIFTFSVTAVKADEVDRAVRMRMAERNIPGAAVAVVKNGRVVKMKGYGLASIEFGVPVTTDTVFEIGSVSKQMTAAGIMLLVQDGKVSLDERISKYLPGTPEDWKDVRVRHLLTHTSGIKSYTSLTGFELSRRVRIDGFIKQLSPYPLEFTPGEKNIYSNSGYNLLAYIIETQSGMAYMDFMRERIFLPLGMTRTGDRDPRNIIRLRAEGYEWQMDRYAGRDGSLTDLMGAGSITSTIADMVKWEAGLRGDKLLTPESKREIWTQFKFNNGSLSPYGLGWRISDVRGVKLIGHTGQTAGFGAAIFRYVDDSVTVITLTNLGELGMGSLIASSVAKAFLPKLSLKNVKIFSGEKPEYSEAFMLALSDRITGKIDEQKFTDSLYRNLTGDRTRAADKRLQGLGKLTRFDYVGSENIDGRTIYRYLAAAGGRMMLWRFAVDEAGKIREMVLEEDE